MGSPEDEVYDRGKPLHPELKISVAVEAWADTARSTLIPSAGRILGVTRSLGFSGQGFGFRFRVR